MVEKLYRLKWTRRDGLGGLVLTPTRELAMQIFEELRKVGEGEGMKGGRRGGGEEGRRGGRRGRKERDRLEGGRGGQETGRSEKGRRRVNEAPGGYCGTWVVLPFL